MEKNGNLVLTPEDVELALQGEISQRLKDLWGNDLTLEDILKEINHGRLHDADRASTKDQG